MFMDFLNHNIIMLYGMIGSKDYPLIILLNNAKNYSKKLFKNIKKLELNGSFHNGFKQQVICGIVLMIIFI